MYAKLAFGNVRKSIRDFSVYFITVLLGVAVFYAFNSITDQEAMSYINPSSNLLGLLGTIIGWVSVFIVVILGLLIVYANRFLMRRRKREFGMYLCLGMQQGHVIRITLIETLIVGAASLVGGLIIGVILSQVLLHVTAMMFSANVPGFAFHFSPSSALGAVCIFAVVFLVSSIANAHSLARSKLIDLMHSEAKSEHIKLRSLPLSLALFVVALVMIGISYKLLVDNGLLDMSPEFMAATVLVCAGTVLFFYSLSGFLLRLVQFARPLYLRGLNMFTLRQVSSKVNTTFLSMSVICITLFLAITSVCGGIGICNTISANLAKQVPCNASVRTMYGDFDTQSGYVANDLGAFRTVVEAHEYDMESGLRESFATAGIDYDDLVSQSSQLDFMVDTSDAFSFADVDAIAERPLAEYAGASTNDTYTEESPYLLSLSQVNSMFSLAGKPTIELDEGECAIIADTDFTSEYFTDITAKHPAISLGGKELTISQFLSDSLETTPFPFNAGAFIVNDSDMPKNVARIYSTLNVNCPDEAAETAFGSACENVQKSTDTNSWPITTAITRQETYDQSVGLSTIIAFLAVYIGFVLVMACAAILAIQQLSEASDSAGRYDLLNKIGAPRAMTNRALFAQIAICFAFPLALAIAHSICALTVVTDVVAMFGHLDIGQMALMCAGAFLVVYGAYFLITYVSAKRFVQPAV